LGTKFGPIGGRLERPLLIWGKREIKKASLAGVCSEAAEKLSGTWCWDGRLPLVFVFSHIKHCDVDLVRRAEETFRRATDHKRTRSRERSSAIRAGQCRFQRFPWIAQSANEQTSELGEIALTKYLRRRRCLNRSAWRPDVPPICRFGRSVSAGSHLSALPVLPNNGSSCRVRIKRHQRDAKSKD
jgi:hypothetical protein